MSNETLKWRCDTPSLIKEIGENMRESGAVVMPLKIFQSILTELTARAIEINDPELNIIMLRLKLYEVDHYEIEDHIKHQESLIQKP